ncbi:MAG: H+-translocating [NiFe] hydrogenase complex, Nuo C-like subunit CooU [Candidatus Desulfovibrio kirbyi]|uniref:H+-translocating [NiFe] hydrogenase complex, Nuo C-like subunit CooU n=1 Tax=Candidatus Desulfovibrio kirbyi TaxID=2696086 RepID=A0A6L2R672_9BACT|nr:MAG: H+-translocating [NiFe] hydrogenase complex, Nuo C-like subunit CooU [Candidatus Desulfovibrio kirbyi]
MQDTLRDNTYITKNIAVLCANGGDVRHSTDAFSNPFHWFTLDNPRLLTKAAEALRNAGARLCMITAYNTRQLGDPMQQVCYHFECERAIINITVILNGEWPTVPSITPLFANADWHEREMMELYGIAVANQPNPRRLFLDEELDQGLLKNSVPLSVMMNGASSSALWERILSDKGAAS